MTPGAGTVALRFDASCVRQRVRAATWQDAVGAVGRVLAEHGFATAAYGAHMIEVIDRFGPYVVIAPGVALVHARPGRDTLANGLAVIALDEPVAFGHPHYDPVQLVLGVAVTRPEEHLTVVASIANAIDEGGVAERTAAMTDPQEFVDRFVQRHVDLSVIPADRR